MLNTKFSPWPSYTQEEADAIQNVLLSNKVNYWTGNQCNNFENEFASWTGVRYAIAVANGTVALEAALKALDVGHGDEVIVTSRTYFASVSSIVTSGAIPVFADVNLDSQNIEPTSIRKKITKKTKAIVCVHLAGWPCEMDEIVKIKNEFNLHLIEDCAQAHGAKYKGKSIGSIGDIGCWSFCQDKIMTTGGEGGMITVNNKSLWSKLWAYKEHGKNYEKVIKKNTNQSFRYLHDSFGSNYRMTEMQAVIGRIQLKKMKNWHHLRLKNAKIIWNFSKLCKGIRVPELYDYIEHAAYKCYIFVNLEMLKDNWSRDRIIKEINNQGVPCYSGSCPEVYLEKAFTRNGLGPKKGFPNAKKIGEESLMFLVHPTLNETEIEETCTAISIVMSQAVS
jgi:dTDP-4-amino-4,6-dideoxygalactose transaminase